MGVVESYVEEALTRLIKRPAPQVIIKSVVRSAKAVELFLDREKERRNREATRHGGEGGGPLHPKINPE